jgi:hypothetical protein
VQWKSHCTQQRHAITADVRSARIHVQLPLAITAGQCVADSSGDHVNVIKSPCKCWNIVAAVMSHRCKVNSSSIQVQCKEVQVMKDVFFAVTIFHSLAAVALFALMAITVVNMINNRIQPKG